jgi:hypothetical protein
MCVVIVVVVEVSQASIPSTHRLVSYQIKFINQSIITKEWKRKKNPPRKEKKAFGESKEQTTTRKELRN